MAADLMLDFEDQLNQRHIAMNGDAMGEMCIDQDGEWDISLFDELENAGAAEELLQAWENGTYADGTPDLDFDIDLPSWGSDTCGDASSICTDTDMTFDPLSLDGGASSASPSSSEALSPFNLHGEPMSPQSLPSPVSVCSETSGSETSGSTDVVQERKPLKRSSQATRARSSQPLKRPLHQTPKVSIQPKPVVTVPVARPIASLQAKAFVIQPLQTSVTIQATALTGRPVILAPPALVAPLRSPQIAPAPPALKLTDSVVAVTTAPPVGAGPFTPVTQPVLGVAPCSSTTDGDESVTRRQQRMIKNRESASLSRKKKKEYLLTLEARLKMALYENRRLKDENGTLKMQLDGLMSENKVLKVTAPKRRAVCLMVVLVFVVLNVGPMSLYDGGPGTKQQEETTAAGRHLLGFSSSSEQHDNEDPQTVQTANRRDQEEKALMVVKKDPLLFGPLPPCQPVVNRTQSVRLAHELRGWVHRHEVQRSKSRRATSGQQKTETVQKSPDQEGEVARIVTVQYTEAPEKSPGNELQVYYARRGFHDNLFEEIHRRGDTFYVVSFRRDHLLLPATSHNKRSRPKMSVVLPAMNINDTVIKDEEYEMMMQIDCEVMDTRILRIKTSSIPTFLRANRSDSYHSAPPNSQATPPVGVLTGSV